MVHTWCAFVAGIHPWMSGSFESVWWNACAHRLDLGLYSHPKEFWGNGIRTHVNSNGKIPSTGEKNLVRRGSNPRRYIKQDSEPNTPRTELFRPLDSKIDRQLLPQCGSAFNCLDRFVPEVTKYVNGTVSNQPTVSFRGQWKENGLGQGSILQQQFYHHHYSFMIIIIYIQHCQGCYFT